MTHPYQHTTARYERLSDTAGQLARGLGWVSIGIGLAELFYGRRLTRSLGMDGDGTLLRAYGLREIGVGLAILAADDPRYGIWARIAGDAVDLATLAGGTDNGRHRPQAARLAAGAVAAITVLDIVCAQALQARQRLAPEPPDYSDRSGFPQDPQAMRGQATAAAAATGRGGEQQAPAAAI
ncbi:cyclase dehydrase [Caenispirillum bisanense]|uniref:cyclase dehydrase n=1 Tax=Caenispirillum bisanense TaxID=414052 RepID=UPI0031E4714E